MLSMRATAIRTVTTVLAGLAVASSSWAATATATINVTASVTLTCKISSTDVVFGQYDPVVTNFSNPLNAPSPGSLVVTCTKSASGVKLALNMGENAHGGSVRKMKKSGGGGGAVDLDYQLYQPSLTTPKAPCAYSTVWGGEGGSNPGTALTPTGTTWGSASPQTFYVCGQIRAGQDVEQGSYADIITATVDF